MSPGVSQGQMLPTNKQTPDPHPAAAHHEDEENKEDEGGEVDRSKHRVRLLNLRELKVPEDDPELSETTQTERHQETSPVIIKHHLSEDFLRQTSPVLQTFLHAGLESAEVVDLGSKHQVGQLSIRQEDDEEHDGEPHQVFGTAGHGAGQLTHGLIEVDELKELRGWRQVSICSDVSMMGTLGEITNLDPGEEDNDCSHIVELDLQV